MELKMIYRGENDPHYSAPIELVDGVGPCFVVEDGDRFLVIPRKITPGVGFKDNTEVTPLVLLKSEGWQGLYCPGAYDFDE